MEKPDERKSYVNLLQTELLAAVSEKLLYEATILFGILNCLSKIAQVISDMRDIDGHRPLRSLL